MIIAFNLYLKSSCLICIHGELGNLPMQGRGKVGARSEQGCWAMPGLGPGKVRAKNKVGAGQVEKRPEQSRSKAGASRIEPKKP